MPVQIRNILERDYATIINVVDDWWGGRHMADMPPPTTPYLVICPDICCSAKATSLLVISPPTEPFSRDGVSGPKLTPNSAAISQFICSIVFLACGVSPAV